MKLNVALIIASLLLAVVSLLLGPISIPMDRILPALLGTGSQSDITIIQDIRLPRILAAFLVGAMLGLSGAALQGMLRNPLAEPGVLGVSATSALFATVTIYFGLSSASGIALPIAAIIGALIATAFLAFAAIKVSSVTVLILIGVGLSSLAGALMSLLLNLSPNPFSLNEMINWTMGTVANRSFDDLLISAPFMLAGTALLIASRRPLTALSLGEQVASSVGVHLPRARLVIVIGCGLCTGAAVSIAGAVGFVGIVAPHLVRPFVHHEPGKTLLPSALLAGLMLMFADLLIRLAPTHQELKLGVVAALIGAPIFILIATQRLGSQR